MPKKKRLEDIRKSITYKSKVFVEPTWAHLLMNQEKDRSGKLVNDFPASGAWEKIKAIKRLTKEIDKQGRTPQSEKNMPKKKEMSRFFKNIKSDLESERKKRRLEQGRRESREMGFDPDKKTDSWEWEDKPGTLSSVAGKEPKKKFKKKEKKKDKTGKIIYHGTKTGKRAYDPVGGRKVFRGSQEVRSGERASQSLELERIRQEKKLQEKIDKMFK